MLARNEIHRDYAYNRALFMRVAQGWYQFNPGLSVRQRQGDEEQWTPIYTVLNLPLINEFSRPDSRRESAGWERLPDVIDHYLTLGGLQKRSMPIATERAVALEAVRQIELQASREHRQAARAGAGPLNSSGETKERRRPEAELLLREWAERKKR